MKIYCPQCGVKGSADDSYSGRKVRCPKCQGMFDLQPDMAIDQGELSTADLDAENQVGAMEPETVQEDVAPVPPVPAEVDLPDTLDEPKEESLDLDLPDDEPLEEIAAIEQEDAKETSLEEDDSLDWGDFGAELDKELADSEQEDSEADADIDQQQDEEGPIADFAAEIDSVLDETDTSDELEEQALTDDGQDASDAQEVDEKPFDEESLEVATEVEEELESGEDDVAEAIEELDVTAVEEVEAVTEQSGEKQEDDSTLATLTAVAAAAPVFAGGEDNKEDEKEVTESLEIDNVMSFAEEDLPETEEEDAPDIIIGEGSDDVVVEDEPYGIDKEQCWQCGKKDSVGEPFVAIDGRLYCTDCSPVDETDEQVEDGVAATPAINAKSENVVDDGAEIQEETAALRPTFTVSGVIKESWEKVKGIKGAVWGASAIMYLVLIVIAAGGSMLLPSSELETETLTSYLPSALFQFVTQALYMLFMGGLLFMGIRRVKGDPVSWKMVFHGFSFTGKIVVVTILQSILITIGFIALILPGIYLTIGYAMAIPLIVDKNLSPWQALETSRKAIHKVWWQVAAIGFLICLLFVVASIPLGLGLIWVWPLALVVSGVVYHRLFDK